MDLNKLFSDKRSQNESSSRYEFDNSNSSHNNEAINICPVPQQQQQQPQLSTDLFANFDHRLVSAMMPSASLSPSTSQISISAAASSPSTSTTAKNDDDEEEDDDEDADDAENEDVDMGPGKAPYSSTSKSSSEKNVVDKNTKSFTFEDVAPYFDKPLKEAAKALNCSVSGLKKKCRLLGIMRWPFRKINSLEKKISQLQETAAKASLSERLRTLKRIEKLEEEINSLKKQQDRDGNNNNNNYSISSSSSSSGSNSGGVTSVKNQTKAKAEGESTSHNQFSQQNLVDSYPLGAFSSAFSSSSTVASPVGAVSFGVDTSPSAQLSNLSQQSGSETPFTMTIRELLACQPDAKPPGGDPTTASLDLFRPEVDSAPSLRVPPYVPLSQYNLGSRTGDFAVPDDNIFRQTPQHQHQHQHQQQQQQQQFQQPLQSQYQSQAQSPSPSPSPYQYHQQLTGMLGRQFQPQQYFPSSSAAHSSSSGMMPPLPQQSRSNYFSAQQQFPFHDDQQHQHSGWSPLLGGLSVPTNQGLLLSKPASSSSSSSPPSSDNSSSLLDGSSYIQQHDVNALAYQSLIEDQKLFPGGRHPHPPQHHMLPGFSSSTAYSTTPSSWPGAQLSLDFNLPSRGDLGGPHYHQYPFRQHQQHMPQPSPFGGGGGGGGGPGDFGDHDFILDPITLGRMPPPPPPPPPLQQPQPQPMPPMFPPRYQQTSNSNSNNFPQFHHNVEDFDTNLRPSIIPSMRAIQDEYYYYYYRGGSGGSGGGGSSSSSISIPTTTTTTAPPHHQHFYHQGQEDDEKPVINTSSGNTGNFNNSGPNPNI